MKQYLEIGKIVSPHGIRGEVKVQPWCDSPEYLCELSTLYFDKGNVALNVKSARPHKGMALLILEGVSDLDAAAALRGKILYMNRDDDPDEGEGYFLQDLIGLVAKHADTGEVYGTLRDVLQTGANDVYLLRDDAGKERLVPMIPDVVTEIDPEAGHLLIRPLEGLFDDAD